MATVFQWCFLTTGLFGSASALAYLSSSASSSPRSSSSSPPPPPILTNAAGIFSTPNILPAGIVSGAEKDGNRGTSVPERSVSERKEVIDADATRQHSQQHYKTLVSTASSRRPRSNKKSDRLLWTHGLGPQASAAVLERYRGTNTLHAPFSLLTWNILSQKLHDITAVQKLGCGTGTGGGAVFKYSWPQRCLWILETLRDADADVVCLQEVDYATYRQHLLPAMTALGYDGAAQGDPDVRDIGRRRGKGARAHAVATFWKRRRFQAWDVARDGEAPTACLARQRTLTTVLRDRGEAVAEDAAPAVLAVVNCHLEGHPNQYAARLRQLQHAMDDLAKRVIKRAPLHGLCVAGDFNCELQSSACATYLKIGRVGRRGGLGGVHGTSALVMPPRLLDTAEAAACLESVMEWGQPIPHDEMEKVLPHPFRENSLVSAYPAFLGRDDPRQHFTFCANPRRPVAGLDQIWYSGLSLARLAVRRPLRDPGDQRANVLAAGLPSPGYPSDHLPIATVLDWRLDEDRAEDGQALPSASSLPRELIITPVHAPPVPKAKSPVMSYAELDMLLVTCPFDSDSQQRELEAICAHVPDVPPDNARPSNDQLAKLSVMRERKKQLLMGASGDAVRKVLQRILKLNKELANYSC